MIWSWVALCLAFLASAAAQGVKIDSSIWENTRYYRVFDLSRPYIKEQGLLEIKNISPEPQDVYILPVNDGFDSLHNISHYEVMFSKQREKAFVFELLEGIYAIKFPYPIAPGSTIELNALFAYTDPIEPFPAKIALGDTQQLILKFNKFCYSPYVTLEYSLTFSGLKKGQEVDLTSKVSNSEGLPELKARVDQEKRTLTYGPIKATIPSYAISPSGLLYDHNFPLTHAINLERSFWLPASDVDVVQTEEYYELTNKGAQLNTGFSRAEWMKGRYAMVNEHHALSQLEFAINEQAPFTDYYVTDKVGMVSTHEITQGHLVIQPRFPLFGGWNYNFTLGWRNSLESFVHRMVDEEDTFIASFPLLNSLRNIYYDNVVINFYLPENAQFLNASTLSPLDNIEVGSELSYLDVADGHVKVTLSLRNIIDGLSDTRVLIKYKYTAASYWRKVARIAAFVFTALISYYALGLVDLSIRK